MRLVALMMAFLLVGSISLTFDPGTSAVVGSLVEVRMGALAPGSSATGSYSQGNASVAGSLISLRTDMVYLNNTNTTGAWYVKLDLTSSSGVSNLVALTVGIDNGTASTGQVIAALGVLTQTTGSYVRLEPSSTNTIYLTQTLTALGPQSGFILDVIASDEPDDGAYVITNAGLTVT